MGHNFSFPCKQPPIILSCPITMSCCDKNGKQTVVAESASDSPPATPALRDNRVEGPNCPCCRPRSYIGHEKPIGVGPDVEVEEGVFEFEEEVGSVGSSSSSEYSEDDMATREFLDMHPLTWPLPMDVEALRNMYASISALPFGIWQKPIGFFREKPEVDLKRKPVPEQALAILEPYTSFPWYDMSHIFLAPPSLPDKIGPEGTLFYLYAYCSMCFRAVYADDELSAEQAVKAVALLETSLYDGYRDLFHSILVACPELASAVAHRVQFFISECQSINKEGGRPAAIAGRIKNAFYTILTSSNSWDKNQIRKFTY